MKKREGHDKFRRQQRPGFAIEGLPDDAAERETGQTDHRPCGSVEDQMLTNEQKASCDAEHKQREGNSIGFIESNIRRPKQHCREGDEEECGGRCGENLNRTHPQLDALECRSSGFFAGPCHQRCGADHSPLPRKTALAVFIRILKSIPRLQEWMYFTSRFMPVWNEGSVLAVICHSPVIPGLTSRRGKCSIEYPDTSSSGWGLGPTRLISPFKTFHSWGSSSRL